MGRLLLSLALAVFLWGFVTLSRDPETTRTFNNVPVASANLAGDLVLVSELPTTSVRVTGPRSAVNQLVASDITASIDFGDIIQTGSYTMRITVDEPEEIWSTEANPENVNVVIERQQAKAVPV